jgi:hypothetical protein
MDGCEAIVRFTVFTVQFEFTFTVLERPKISSLSYFLWGHQWIDAWNVSAYSLEGVNSVSIA